ncbi:glycosyltransferase [Rubellimicrobium roseum]|uniref:Glycosyltransferase family 4 protein n=1 Tax=Rubellimicrobium roseum TaxID=687525 RepID=A0A5C4NFQ2_9RHOB|nr:glycosyltransferase [Rubellimicrobium roseum]TNC71477.1 glycosyltransferase family 4 protein [Rubellimicrobium roseum]
MSQTPTRPRIYYFCLVNTQRYNQIAGDGSYVGAASNKVSALSAALRQRGQRSCVVSMPLCGRGAAPPASATLLRDNGLPWLFLRSHRSRWRRKFSALAQFAWFSLWVVDRHDRVILYNHGFEYLLALFVLRLRGVVTVLDIEDAPRLDEPGLRPAVDRLMFPAFLKLTSARKIVASRGVGEGLKLREFTPVYGAINAPTRRPEPRATWTDVGMTAANPLRIWYGGTIERDTGLDLFCEVLPLLGERLAEAGRYVVFEVTGRGGEAAIAAAQAAACDNLKVEQRQDLDRPSFLAVLRACHVGLSLRITDSSLAQSTFPSKVVEITQHGLALIATPSADLLHIYGSDGAVILGDCAPHSLAEAIMLALHDTSALQEMAQAGFDRSLDQFEAGRVADRLVLSLGLKVRDLRTAPDPASAETCPTAPR